MFKLLKFIIWVAGFLVISFLVLDYFGYKINTDYFNESKAQCEQRLRDCSDSLLHKGIDNAQCDFVCADPKLIIKKK